MKRPNNNVRPAKKSASKPVVEIDRWEGEGGNPPVARALKSDPSPTIAGILKKLLVDWHLINAPSSK